MHSKNLGCYSFSSSGDSTVCALPNWLLIFLCHLYLLLKTFIRETRSPFPPFSLSSELHFVTLATISLTLGPQTLAPTEHTATLSNKWEKKKKRLLSVWLNSLNFIQFKLNLAFSYFTFFYVPLKKLFIVVMTSGEKKGENTH